ncbi:MAG TPA: energy-coupling factor transporter transmembrane component T [Patescibacteria group bacterium]|nr:energy-coupling factor transporter transmembrane component T [Patescibacteria group bacterium]
MIMNARAWVVWVGAAMVATMVAQNPLYSLTILMAALVVSQNFGRQDNGFRLPIGRISLFVVAFSAVYTALFVHEGTTILFELPDWPLIGGAITLEALVEGASNGLVLVALLAIFAALNAIVPVSELVRLVPGALHDLGVVILVAVTYVPETRRQLTRIRQAQEIRGHQLSGVRDWQPIVVPLLVGGLERSMRLAETMVARGYGATTHKNSSTGERLLLVLGLVAALTGWLLVLWLGWPGWLLLASGLLAVVVILVRRGRAIRRTRYRVEVWSRRDILLVTVAIVALLAVLVPWSWVDQSSLAYSPFQTVSLPPYDLFIGLALASLALPAFLATRKG